MPAYTARLVKSPKAFWNDSALAAFLSGYYAEDGLRHARELGAYCETLIFHPLRVLGELLVPSARLYFWRLENGQEVAFVVEHGRRLLGIEVKMSAQVGYGDTAALRQFSSAYSQASGGLIVYQGQVVRHLSDKIVAIPWMLLTG